MSISKVLTALIGEAKRLSRRPWKGSYRPAATRNW